MNRTTRQLTALATLSLTAWGCAEFTNVAHAQAPACGGNSKVHMAPINCERTTTVDGIRGSVRLVVDDTGFGMVTAVVQDLTPNTPMPPLYLQVKIHKGISSDPAGVVAATDVFDGNTASLNLTMPRSLPDNCTSQWDIKIVPGSPTTTHVSPTYRVAAPLVGIDLAYCQPATTTTTAPTTVPVTTVPGSSSPTTSPTSTPGSGVSTTNLPPSSVVGGTIPATGNNGDTVGYAILALFGGAFLWILAYARKHPAS